MKHNYLSFLLTLLMSIAASIASAHDFEVDGIYYNITSAEDLTVEVTSGTGKYTGSVTIPASINYSGKNYSVTSIGYEAFDNCSGLTSITIPESVTSIEGSAFYCCSKLTSIAIPEGVTSIGDFAFSNCSGLTSITIPERVTSIGDNAFSGCIGLTAITIPSSVTSIGDYAFNYCSGLTSIIIPEGVTSIGKGAFSSCRGLTSVIVADGNTVYDSRNNCNAIIETSSNTIIAGCQNTFIPESVTCIGDNAFQGCSGLTSITIPESVTSIEGSAFSGCTGLTSITIPEGVTSIGNHAFSGCSGLTSITVPEGVTSIGSRAFRNCSGLTSITIPESVTSIGDNAFYGTPWYNNQPDGLVYAGKVAYIYKGTMPENTHIELAEGTKGIAGRAFYGCSGLTSVTIPSSVTSIGSSAFERCISIISVKVIVYDYSAFCNNKIIGTIRYYYDKPILLIDMDGKEIKNYIIPEGVTSIGDYAFNNCSGLTSVTIPEGVTSIGESAFDGCSGLTSITIPEGVTSIGDEAFYDCSGLTSITIPEGVTSIEGSAFYGCSGLTSVTIPSSVTSIGVGAFSGCSNLTSITISEGVTSIGSRAFYDCSSLTYIFISKNVTSIGKNAFGSCSKLTDCYCYASTVPTTSTNAFTNQYIMNATLHVPAASIEDYNYAEPWYNFGTIVALTPEAVGVESVKAAAGQSSQKIYSLDGKLLQKPQKGINIVGGKKAFFK